MGRDRRQQRLLVAGRVNRFIPNPTFDPVARPGRARRLLPRPQGGRRYARRVRRARSDQPAYRNRDARLRDGRAGHGGLLPLPDTRCGHGAGAVHDPEAADAVFHASTGGSTKTGVSTTSDRIFAAPTSRCSTSTGRSPRSTGRWARRAGGRDARRPGAGTRPAPLTRRPGRTTRSGRGSTRPASRSRSTRATAATPLRARTGARAARWRRSVRPVQDDHVDRPPIDDPFTALICHGVLARHPDVRIATIESGSEWVPPLVQEDEEGYGQCPCVPVGRPDRDAARTRLGLAVLR